MGHWINKLNYVFCCDWCDQIDRCLAGEDCLELHVNPALCAACVSATQASARMCECPPIAGFGWCSEPGSSVSPSSKVSSSSQEKQDIYTQRCQSLFFTHTHTVEQTHTQSHSVFTLTEQSGAPASEECLSQSVPSRCVSIDNCCVKYYNKQNSKMVLACQQLPYFNHVCRLLAEMENSPSLKQKAPCSPSAI